MSNRFITPVELPTPFEDELLKVFIEECLEAGIRALKAQRFGLGETQPGQGFSNRQRLGHEIGDILTMVALLTDWGLVDDESVEWGMNNKRGQLDKYFQNQPPGGLWAKEA